jgi:hypothetical protein
MPGMPGRKPNGHGGGIANTDDGGCLRKEKTMKKEMLLLAMALILGIAFYPQEGRTQMGRGMMGGGWDNPYSGQSAGPGHSFGVGPGMLGGWVTVPEKLPKPKSTEWIQKLQEVLNLEKQSYDQYTIDEEKYNIAMPYMMVIPQESEHIYLIERLFAAYGLKSDGKLEPVVETRSLKEALELCVRLEQELLPRYTWLVQKAEDRDSARVLNQILLQSRMHLAMFQHTLGMGGQSMGPGMMGRGYGMGPGMRGPGMDPGMMGPGYTFGPEYPQLKTPLDEKDVKTIVENYLRTTRNPNLKLGKITEQGNSFQAEILTQEGSLVDKLLVDRDTGRMRSIY